MKIIVGNNKSKIIFTDEKDREIKEIRKSIHEGIDPLDPQRFRLAAFRRHLWDGRKKIYNIKEDTFPTGLLDDVKRIVSPLLEEIGQKLTVIDEQGTPIIPESIDKEITLLNGKDKPIIMNPTDPIRGYQYRAITDALSYQRMVVNSSTNSGKCVSIDTPILTSTGYRTIGQIIFSMGQYKNLSEERIIEDIPDDLFLVNMFGTLEKPSALTFNGLKDVITVYSGRSKETVTKNHPFLRYTDNRLDFVLAEELDVGDTVVQVNFGVRRNTSDRIALEKISSVLKGNHVDDPGNPLSYGLAKITKIKKLKKKIPTFDFSMPITHTFIGDSFVNHNTEIAAGIIKEDLKCLDKDDLVFFISHTVSIAEQSQARLEKRLGVPVGFWGNGKKELHQVNSVMIKTLHNALQEPEKTIKLTSAKDKALRYMAKVVVPPLLKYPNTRSAVKLFLRNNQPKYAYLESSFSELVSIANDSKSDADARKALSYYSNAYVKRLKSKNAKLYKDYEDTLNIINRVKVVIVDECHHAVSPTYQEVLEKLPNARQRIGLSGSINKRNPEKWNYLKGAFSPHTFDVTNKQMIDKGISAKPWISFVPITKPENLTELVDKELVSYPPEKQSSDLIKYSIAYRLGVLENDYRNSVICLLADKLSKKNNGGILIVVNSIEHGTIIQDKLKELGKNSYFLRGEVDSENRHTMLQDIEKGNEDILIGTSVIDEGIDLPNLKYLIYASAGSSERVVKQRIGRVLRVSQSKKSTQIFDLVDRTDPVLFNQARERYKIYQKEKFSFANKF